MLGGAGRPLNSLALSISNLHLALTAGQHIWKAAKYIDNISILNTSLCLDDTTFVQDSFYGLIDELM